jgi:hypothetical protein
MKTAADLDSGAGHPLDHLLDGQAGAGLAERARRAVLAQPPRVQAMYASHLSGDLPPLRALGILRQLRQLAEAGTYVQEGDRQ